MNDTQSTSFGGLVKGVIKDVAKELATIPVDVVRDAAGVKRDRSKDSTPEHTVTSQISNEAAGKQSEIDRQASSDTSGELLIRRKDHSRSQRDQFNEDYQLNKNESSHTRQDTRNSLDYSAERQRTNAEVQSDRDYRNRDYHQLNKNEKTHSRQDTRNHQDYSAEQQRSNVAVQSDRDYRNRDYQRSAQNFSQENHQSSVDNLALDKNHDMNVMAATHIGEERQAALDKSRFTVYNSSTSSGASRQESDINVYAVEDATVSPLSGNVDLLETPTGSDSLLVSSEVLNVEEPQVVEKSVPVSLPGYINSIVDEVTAELRESVWYGYGTTSSV